MAKKEKESEPETDFEFEGDDKSQEVEIEPVIFVWGRRVERLCELERGGLRFHPTKEKESKGLLYKLVHN